MLMTITKLRSSMAQAAIRRRCLRWFPPVAAAILFSAGCAHKKDASSLLVKDADSIRTHAEQSPRSGGVEVIKLETGREFRFKGLAIDLKTEKAYLGSWDKKEIVVVSLKEKEHSTIKTGYSGKLNGMGVYIKRDKLYAVMNEVNDSPNARPVSVLLVIDITNNYVLRSYEAVGVKGRHHFNHVAVDDNGTAYVSDTRRGVSDLPLRKRVGTGSPWPLRKLEKQSEEADDGMVQHSQGAAARPVSARKRLA